MKRRFFLHGGDHGEPSRTNWPWVTTIALVLMIGMALMGKGCQ